MQSNSINLCTRSPDIFAYTDTTLFQEEGMDLTLYLSGQFRGLN